MHQGAVAVSGDREAKWMAPDLAVRGGMQKSVALVLSLVAVLSAVVAQPARAQRTPSSQAPVVGAFDFDKRTDPITDEDRSAISTPSMAAESGGGRVAVLMWGCRSDGLSIAYTFDKYLGGVNNALVVRYRFADAPSTEWRRWELGPNHRIAFMPMGDVTMFTHEARSFQTVTVHAMDLNGEVTDVFRLDGLTEALRLLTCYRPSGSTP
jgi:hypothetical protein